MVVGDGMTSFPILTTKKPGVSLTTWGGLSTNANDDDNDDTPPPPPENDGDAPRGEGGRDDDGAGRRRDGGGGEQGRGCDERDERDDCDRSSGSA